MVGCGTPYGDALKASVRAPAHDDLLLLPNDDTGVTLVTWQTARPKGCEVFVTVEPELRLFCSDVAHSHRIAQYLGLPARAASRRRVWILTARARDLFRPCRDSSLETSACGSSFPSRGDPKNRLWFERQMRTSHDGSGEDYPFTGMGYTYDWGDADSVRGASEFVVRAQSYRVVGSCDTREYCRGTCDGSPSRHEESGQ